MLLVAAGLLFGLAPARQLLHLNADILGHGLRLTAVGIALGLALAAGAARLLQSLLFGVAPTDAVTLAGMAALLVLVAAATSLVPALRASRVDPLVALRDE